MHAWPWGACLPVCDRAQGLGVHCRSETILRPCAQTICFIWVSVREEEQTLREHKWWPCGVDIFVEVVQVQFMVLLLEGPTFAELFLDVTTRIPLQPRKCSRYIDRCVESLLA